MISQPIPLLPSPLANIVIYFSSKASLCCSVLLNSIPLLQSVTPYFTLPPYPHIYIYIYMHTFSLFPFPTGYVIPFRLTALYCNFTYNSHNSPILGLIHNKELALKAAEESANSNGSSRFERKISMNQLSNIERYTVWKGRVVG